PAGGGHVWMTLNHALDEGQLYREALEAGVSFIPGGAMLIERPQATHLRLSFSMLDPDQLIEGVRRLAGVVRSLQAARASRRTIPTDFLGLSMEVKNLPQLAQFATRGDLVSLMRSLGEGVLRLGGVSADKFAAWTGTGAKLPHWAKTAVSVQGLRGIADLARR